MGFNYYAFDLDGDERIFYTYVTLNDAEDILSWAVRYGFIKECDIENCSNVRFLSPVEVENRNKALYKEWWERHKNDESLSGQMPPTIGEVQLN